MPWPWSRMRLDRALENPHSMSLDLTRWTFFKFDPISSNIRSRELLRYVKTDDHVFWFFPPFQRLWSALHCWIALRATRSPLLTTFWWSTSRDLRPWCLTSSRNAWDMSSESPLPGPTHPRYCVHTVVLTDMWICKMYILYLFNMWTYLKC